MAVIKSASWRCNLFSEGYLFAERAFATSSVPNQKIIKGATGWYRILNRWHRRFYVWHKTSSAWMGVEALFQLASCSSLVSLVLFAHITAIYVSNNRIDVI